MPDVAAIERFRSSPAYCSAFDDDTLLTDEEFENMMRPSNSDLEFSQVTPADLNRQ